jgi:hypothetical protein
MGVLITAQGNAKAFGAVAFHLRSEHQLWYGFCHGSFHRQVVVTDQGF